MVTRTKLESDELKNQLFGILDCYYESIYSPNTLWEIICDELEIYDDNELSEYFDYLMKEYYSHPKYTTLKK